MAVLIETNLEYNTVHWSQEYSAKSWVLMWRTAYYTA